MFRLVNINDRAAFDYDGSWYDLAELSGDATLADPLTAVACHRDLLELYGRYASEAGDGQVADAVLGAPVPQPRQVFGIGLNYRDHAGESGAPLPPAPLTFTKFPSCIAGATADVPLSGAMVDWEVEIVAVIGEETANVAVCLGKSFTNYGPIGPALVSIDAFADPDDLALWCDVAGERMQAARSSLHNTCRAGAGPLAT